MELSEIFKQFPLFHKWAENKKLNAQDLSILTEFEISLPFKSLIQWIEKHQPTHSEGLQILDLGGECLLMRRSLSSGLLKEAKASLFIEGLKKLRLKESFARDEKKKRIVQNQAWGVIKARWLRQGDRGALSIQFQSFSLQDFKQKIQKLNSVYESLNKEPEKLWGD